MLVLNIKDTKSSRVYNLKALINILSTPLKRALYISPENQ